MSKPENQPTFLGKNRPITSVATSVRAAQGITLWSCSCARKASVVLTSSTRSIVAWAKMRPFLPNHKGPVRVLQIRGSLGLRAGATAFALRLP